MTHYATSLFIFRRDLRLDDNTALNQALQLSERVIPCFIFDPRQLEPHPYQSQTGLQFMLQALDDLQQQLHSLGAELALYHAAPTQVLKQLFAQYAIQAVFTNRDYTPFSRRRDAELAIVCQALGVAFYSVADALLTEPEHVVKSDQSPYKVFTAFYNTARRLPVALPRPRRQDNFLLVAPEVTLDQIGFSTETSTLAPKIGSRQQALASLQALARYTDYQTTRDFPALNATSHWSAPLKFGICSVREVFHAITAQLGGDHALIRQLYWRDFFTHIAYHFPYVFGRAFNEKFAALPWHNNPDYFHAWCHGQTGFPIVDAGMRELNTTGFMHNRVRMIVASFLVKDLHISWRWGERYFAQHLVDYDPCVNNGNWQWAASTGCDAQPYFRIFNPWLQQQKFDPACQYIYHWLPEVKAIPITTLHQWHKQHHVCHYPAPIIDHAVESQVAKALFKAALALVLVEPL